MTAAVMTSIVGKLSDIYGKKKILITIMIIYTIGISLAGFSTNLYFLLITRTIQGFVMSLFPIVFSIIRDKFPREKISIGNGIISSLIAAGAVIGLMFGGTIIKDYGWQALFFTIIPVAIALLIIIWRFMQTEEEKLGARYRKQALLRISTSDRQNNRKYVNFDTIDIKGAVTLAVTISSFLRVLTYLETGNIDSNTDNYNSAAINRSTLQIASFVITGLVPLLLFIKIEWQSSHPLIEFSLLLHKSILPSNLLIMIVGS
jgi:MFS family permease